jgi:hypothetical protein
MPGLLSMDPREVPSALLRAQILYSLTTFGQLAALDALVTADGWTKEKSFGFVAGPNNNAVYVFLALTGDLFIFIGGCATPADGRNLWDGYVGSYLWSSSNDPHPWYKQRAAWIFANGISDVRYPRQCIVATHSAGAGVAILLMALMQANFSAPFPAGLCAFGTPAVGHTADIQTSGFGAWTHWMNVDDAVPLVPPSLTSYERITAGLSVFQCQYLSLWAFLGSGIQIGLAGQINAGNSPASSPVPATSQIGNWLASQEAGLETPHSLNVYVARLTLAVGPTPSAPVIAPTAAPLVAVVQPPVTVIRQAIADTVQTQFADASRQNAQPVDIPPANLFYAQRAGKVWSVFFGGVKVADAPHKRRARSLANLGNAWLRRLQNEAVVYTDDLGSQFAAYLSAAADPTSGIEPTMNTDISS